MNRVGSEAAPSGAYRTYFCTIILLVFGLVAYVWGNVKTAAQGRELERLRNERKALIHRQDRLKAKVAGLKRSSRIRGIAVRELGMVFPSEPPRNLYLNPAGRSAAGAKGRNAD